MAEINLGDKVQDAYTGLTGFATARYIFLYGCTRIRIEPGELKDGKPIEGQTFDEQRLKLIEAGGVTPAHPPPRIPLGAKVKDRITGYTGIVTAHYLHLHSTPSLCVEAQELTKDGKPIDPVGFDEHRLELVEEKEIENHAPHVKTGGPQPNEAQARRPGP